MSGAIIARSGINAKRILLSESETVILYCEFWQLVILLWMYAYHFWCNILRSSATFWVGCSINFAPKMCCASVVVSSCRRVTCAQCHMCTVSHVHSVTCAQCNMCTCNMWHMSHVTHVTHVTWKMSELSKLWNSKNWKLWFSVFNIFLLFKSF